MCITDAARVGDLATIKEALDVSGPGFYLRGNFIVGGTRGLSRSSKKQGPSLQGRLAFIPDGLSLFVCLVARWHGSGETRCVCAISFE